MISRFFVFPLATCIAWLITLTGAFCQNNDTIGSHREQWVDSVLKTLTVEERVAQLFSVRAYSNKGGAHEKEIIDLIEKHKIGGLTFFQGGPVRQVALTNDYQKRSDVPLLILQDAEWGLGMRLDSCHSFPFQMTAGALSSDEPVREMGLETGKQLRSLGVHVNLAPVVDINNNPANPVINYRSFGEDRHDVARKAIAFMEGMQDAGILTVAKHFPGHGDTRTDSHLELPVIHHNRAHLDSVELFPFKKMIDAGVEGIMIAHLYLPEFDSGQKLPATLSKNVVTGLLKKDLGFEGFIITDALDMKGVTDDFKPGEIELMAFQAGNDILLLPLDVPKAIRKFKQALRREIITEEEITQRCRKILGLKYDAGLAHNMPAKADTLDDILGNPANSLINRRIFRDAVTVVKNRDSLLPVIHAQSKNTALVTVGEDDVTPFREIIENYARIETFYIGVDITAEYARELKDSLSKNDLIIIGVHSVSSYRSDYGITDRVKNFITDLADNKEVVLVLFGNPYSLSGFSAPDSIESIIIAYQNTEDAQEIAAQVIYGSMDGKGRLPVTAAPGFPVNTGFNIRSRGKLAYVIPEEVNVCRDTLALIDSLIISSIEDKVFPGCQVLASLDGQVFYHRAFGFHTYENDRPVRKTDLYDLASITKIASSAIALMKLDGEGKIDIDRPLGNYLPYLKNTDKEKIIIREMMAHQSGLKPWIPFYEFTLKNNKPDATVYSNEIGENYPFRVAENMYIHKDYRYRILDSVSFSLLSGKARYTYSDLGYYFLMQIIENAGNRSLDNFVYENFYSAMSLPTVGYRPLQRFPRDGIVPTEDDRVFRMQVLHGDVHDPGAAMMGGVAGHAGLFSNASDLAVIMQMLLQGGKYAGERYLDSGLVKEYTKCQFPLNDNRRGVGFDKPPLDYYPDGPVCRSASADSFGHSGFTGTYAWADPENGLVFIFLSNRIHPDADNGEISKRNIRTKIHELLYHSIKAAE